VSSVTVTGFFLNVVQPPYNFLLVKSTSKTKGPPPTCDVGKRHRDMLHKAIGVACLRSSAFARVVLNRWFED
jgi:hypothetical protein